MSSSQQDQPSTSSATMDLQSLAQTQQTITSTFSTEFPSNPVEILNLKKSLSQHEFIKIVEIANCPTTLDASKLISNSIFKSLLEPLKNFTALILKANEQLNEWHAEKPKIHEFKIERNFLISYESQKAKIEKIIYWKNGKEGKYLTINLIKGYSAEMTDFVRNFLIDNVNMNYDKSTNNNLELPNLKDINNLNLLMKAIESEQTTTLINELLLLPFDINQKSSNGKTAADIALKTENNQILLQLLEANSTLPNNFYADELEIDEFSEKIKKFLDISKNMHNAIRLNNLIIINDLIKQKPNLRYFYNLNNVSAATAALNAKNFTAYKILLKNKCSIGPNENFDHVIDNAYENHEKYEPEKKKIKSDLTDVHDNVSKPLPEKHLLILCANSQICHDDQQDKQRLKIIKDAFNNLNEIPITRQILQLISMHKNFKIYFDFNRSSVEFMNPTGGDAQMSGLFGDFNGINKASLYFAAKELLLNDDDDKFAAPGTLAHELCHFAMNLTFCNEAKPYAIDDKENTVRFNAIIEKYKVISLKTSKQKEEINKFQKQITFCENLHYKSINQMKICANERLICENSRKFNRELDSNTDNMSSKRNNLDYSKIKSNEKTLKIEKKQTEKLTLKNIGIQKQLEKCNDELQLCNLNHTASMTSKLVKEIENIVNSVFNNYDEHLWSSKLIVLVPQMIVHYQNDSKILNELKVTFEDLFDYYNDVIVPTMKRKIYELEQHDSTFFTEFPSSEIEILKFKDSLTSQEKSIEIIEIQNCPTTLDASKLVSNSIFCSSLVSFNDFTILKLQIDEKLNENHAEKPQINEFNIARNFLISFESTTKNYENQKIIYWKNADRFTTIKLIEGFSTELTDFVRNFLVDIVDIDSSHSDNSELIDLMDSNGCNLLMKAVDAQQTTLVDELLNLPFYINTKSKDGKSAADIAWEKKNFEILILLLEANSTFPNNFNAVKLDVDEASYKIEEYLKICNEMHKAIKSNDSAKVLELINEKSNLSCFYDSSNVSAATIAIKSNKPEIYKLLTENECVIGPEEDFNEIIQQNKEITSAHDSASIELPEQHLMILLTNSVICHNSDSNKLRWKGIKEAFNTLNEILELRTILKLTAMQKNFKTHFDFNRTSVEFMNPSGCDQNTRGLFQNNKSNEFSIYIGAKDLLDEKQKFTAIGTLAHELCHFAMYLTFFNDAKPYDIDDKENKAKLNEIIEQCKVIPLKIKECKNQIEKSPEQALYYENLLRKRSYESIEIVKFKVSISNSENQIEECNKELQVCNLNHQASMTEHQNEISNFVKIIEDIKARNDYEEIVSLVFECYDEDLWPAELIVRVPHMIVHYQNNPQRLNELKVIFEDLFDYYNELVVPKMSQKLNELERNHSTFSTDFPSNAIEILNLKKNLEHKNWIKVVEIKNCPTTLDASKLISNSIFRSALESLKNFSILIIKINEELKEQHAEKPKIYEIKIDKHFLVSFESTFRSLKNQKIIYWKNSQLFLTFKLLEGYSAELTDFVRDFLIEIVDLHLADESLINSLEIVDLIDKTGLNLLMKAVDENRSKELIDELLKLPFDINQKTFKSTDNAADLAWKNKNFKILLRLLETNSKYPKDFDENLTTKEIKEFINITNDLHQAVKDKNKPKVFEICKKKPKLRYFYNTSNVSAAAIAIKSDQFEIYKILLVNDLSIGMEEDLTEIIENSFIDETKQKRVKNVIFNTHSRASKPLTEKHLAILLANSVISHDDQFVKLRNRVVKEVFEILNSVPIMREILKIVTSHKFLKIHFDFNRFSVQYMNPINGTKNMRGVFYYNGNVYIAAKSFLIPSVKNDGIGSLAHELAHFALNMTFCNSAKPFAIDDKENEEKFAGIIEICKIVKGKEIIVNEAFLCSNDVIDAELIVRVPHMTVQYRNNSNKMSDLKITFYELFDYYEKVVKSTMLRTLPSLEILFNYSTKVRYSDLTDAYKAKIHHSEVNFQGVEVKFNEIIEDKNSKVFHHLSSEQIREIVIDESILKIGNVQECETKFYIEREFIENNYESEMRYLKNFDEISAECESTKMILLADHAGSGKTMTFMHLSLKLKKNFSNYWISYIDLKSHLKVYEKFEQNFEVLEILSEIIGTSDKFEVELFKNLIDSDRVVLLFDGVDEIAPKFKNFFIKIIESVKNSTRNQQWISTRPQHMQELSSKFNQKAHKLLPYNSDKKIEFIKNVFKNLKVENIQAEDVLSDIKNISEDEIDSPLMLQMMTKLYVQDKTILKYFNLYSLYEKMIEMKKDIVVEEKGKIVNEDRDNRNSKLTIWQVHQIYALNLMYKDGFVDYFNDYKKINVNEFQLLKRWNRNEKSKWTPEAISRYGFLTVDSWNTDSEFPDFVHQTFAEYFVAKFLINNLYELDDSDIDEINDNELGLRFNFFINIISINQRFLESYLINNLNERLSKTFYDFIRVKKIEDNLINNEDIMLKLIKFSVIDLKKFSYNNQTIFQIFLEKYLNLDHLLDVVEIYEKRFSNEWIYHTGYSFKNANFDKFDNLEFIKETIDEDDDTFSYAKIKCQNFYKLLCFFQQAEIPRNNLLNLIDENLVKMIYISLRSTSIIDKFFETIISYHEMEEFFIQKIVKKYIYYAELPSQPTVEFYSNIKYFCDKTEQVFHSVDLKLFQPEIFSIFCGLENLIDLYKKQNYFSQVEIQNFFIKKSVHIIHEIGQRKSNIFLDSFESFMEEIFLNGSTEDFNKNQLKKFLKIRKTNKESLIANMSKLKEEFCENDEICLLKLSKVEYVLKNLTEKVEIKKHNPFPKKKKKYTRDNMEINGVK